MNRQKFLHHYLPAHLIAALFSGGLVEFICSDNSADAGNISQRRKKVKMTILVGTASICIIWFFFYFRPITYGDVSLTPAEVKARQWLDIKLHYAK